ncbi:cytochrome d ubiquinol oxidase subunit II [Sessilibacter sp. MAH4]
MFDYELLKIIWWLLVGVLLIGFAVTDGFDMGVLSLLKIVGKTDNERRVMLNTVGPHWDGNQVWFITAGGAIFAAWPIVYAVAFSGLYWALLLVLFALFFRPVGFEYRSKIETARWRNNWDWLLTAGSAIPALVFGVAFGNLFLGLPFTIDADLRSYYEGSFWQLLSPFAILCGLVSVIMLAMHGAVFLQMRTDDDVYLRSRSVAQITALATFVLFILAGIWVYFMPGMDIVDIKTTAGVVTPLQKTVVEVESGWFANYGKYPLFMLAPVIALVSLLATAFLSKLNKPGFAFTFSSIAIAGIILTAAFSLFPFIMPSSINPSVSLTMWDVVSSQKTLNIMLWVAIIFVPIVLSYTLWGYYKMWGRVSTKFVEDNKFGTY